MITDEFRSSQAAIRGPLPTAAPPPSSSPSAPREIPSGPAQGRALLCAVDMEIDPNAMPLNGATNRTRSCGANLRPAPPSSVHRRCSRSRFAVAPLRICTTLHHFAPLCSDFEGGLHLKPSENVSLALPMPLQFWSGLQPPRSSAHRPALTASRLPPRAYRQTQVPPSPDTRNCKTW
jgi:hypothetical protein